MNVALVVNPFATRVSEERLAEVRAELERVAELDVLLTERPGHATELVTEARRGGADAVVVFSGDGGFNEALNGLESDVPIGFLPGGGTSVLSRALGLPRDPVEAARAGRRRAGGRPDAPDHARPRQRPAVRVRRRHRPARRGRAAGGRSRPAWRRKSSRRSRVRVGDRPRARGAAGTARAAARDRGLRAGGCRLRRERQSVHVCRPVPLPIVREAEFEHGLDLVAPVEVAPPRCRRWRLAS